MFRKTLIAAAIAMATLSAGTTGASAMNLNNAIAIEAPQSAGTVQTVGFKKAFKFRKFHRFHRFNNHYYGHSCHWLKRKAYRTGSRYWWTRYRICRAHRFY